MNGTAPSFWSYIHIMEHVYVCMMYVTHIACIQTYIQTCIHTYIHIYLHIIHYIHTYYIHTYLHSSGAHIQKLDGVFGQPAAVLGHIVAPVLGALFMFEMFY